MKLTVSGAAIGTVAGFLIGVAGSMVFDSVYDNWDNITEGFSNVFSGIGSLFA